jgi:hypothetical protein
MNPRRFVVLLVALAMLLGSSIALADDKNDNKMQEGAVVSAGSGKLTIKDTNNTEHSYSVDNSVKVTVDGKNAKLEDLKKGMKVTVGLDGDKVLSITSGDPKKQPKGVATG